MNRLTINSVCTCSSENTCTYRLTINSVCTCSSENTCHTNAQSRGSTKYYVCLIHTCTCTCIIASELCMHTCNEGNVSGRRFEVLIKYMYCTCTFISLLYVAIFDQYHSCNYTVILGGLRPIMCWEERDRRNNHDSG